MFSEHFIFGLFLIYAGAVIFATAALLTRQSLLVAYILLGLVLGPYGAKFITNAQLLSNAGAVGIIFLLFLVGLKMDLRDLLSSLQKVSIVTLGSSGILWVLGYIICCFLGFDLKDAIIIAVSITFSSTIIALKLLPDRALSESRIGEIIVGILLLEDFIAILMLFLLEAARTDGGFDKWDLIRATLGVPVLLVVSMLGQRYVIMPLSRYFWWMKEYVFLLAIAWCIGMAEFGQILGLSDGIGAFFAGISIASNSDIAKLIDQFLSPLKDFFLILFFFSVGAAFDYRIAGTVILPAVILCLFVLLIKPLVYGWFLRKNGEELSDSKEIAIRLGQTSEFSLLICAIAADIAPRLITIKAEYTIEVVTLLSFIVSCYIVIWRYATPMRR